LAKRSEQVRQIALEAHRSQIRERLREEMNQKESEIHLLYAALLIALHDSPDLNIEAYLDAVNRMAGEIRSKQDSDDAMPGRMQDLVAYLFEENGYHGSFTDYENAANSYLNKVIDDREGLPITLSVLFIELAERLGIHGVAGLPLPGHFLVRYQPEEGNPQLIDVFNAGTVLSFDEADQLALSYQDTPVDSARMSPASKHDIVMRMLTNLRYFTQRNQSLADALPYLDMMIAIEEENPNLRLERATMRLRVGQRAGARSDFEWLLEKQPAGFQLNRIRQALESL